MGTCVARTVVVFLLGLSALGVGAESLEGQLDGLFSSGTAFLDYFSFQQMMSLGSDIQLITPYSTLPGELRKASENLILSTYPDILCVKLRQDAGGAISAASLSMTGIGIRCAFVANEANASGGAILTTGKVRIFGNKGGISFVNNRSKNSGGAIQCSEFAFQGNQGVGYFGYNLANNNGGAVSSDSNIRIENNTGAFLSVCNYSFSGTGGGCLSSKDLVVSGNKSPIYFVANRSRNGGAICCYVRGERSVCNISNNKGGVFFLENSSANAFNGGAINSYVCHIQDNTYVSFNNNYAYYRGGSVSGVELSIIGNGPVSFTNDRAFFGGSIYLGSTVNSEMFSLPILTLSADNGDISFRNNYASNNTVPYCNSIRLYRLAEFAIGAREPWKVAFYDPIESQFATSKTCLINGKDYHSGTVLFSSKYVPYALTDVANFTSYIGHTVYLKNGALAVEDGAVLALYKFIQDGGVVRLGKNGTISSNGVGSQNTSDTGLTKNLIGATTGCSIEINNLALNLPSILSEEESPPILWIKPLPAGGADDKPSISVRGPLSILDDNNSLPYDSLDLSEGKTHVPLLHLAEWEQNKISVVDLDIEAINDVDHYGYQGKWTPYWEEYTVAASNTIAPDANTHHRILYANWTPIGYVPNPIYKTNLIANALWGSYYATLFGLEDNSDEIRRFGVHGLGKEIFLHQKMRSNIPGFRMRSVGYTAGVSTVFKRDHQFTGSFQQLFSQIRSVQGRLGSKDCSCICRFSMPWLSESLFTVISGMYNYGRHHAIHFYHDASSSEGDFYSHTYGGSIRLDFPHRIAKAVITPFLEITGVRSILSTFTEVGEQTRCFSMLRPFYQLISPIGIRSYVFTKNRLAAEWELQLAYQPIIYGQDSQILTRRMASQGSWVVSGTPVSKNALSYVVGQRVQILPNLKWIMKYKGCWSSSTFYNYLKAGSFLSF